MKYKRLTKSYKGAPLHTDMEVTDGDEIYERLAELEDKIEQGKLIEMPRMFRNKMNGIGWFVEYIGDCGWIKSEYHSTEEQARKRLKEVQNAR